MKRITKLSVAIIIVLNLLFSNGCRCSRKKHNNDPTAPSTNTMTFQPSGTPTNNSVYLQEVSAGNGVLILNINVKGGVNVYGAALEIDYDSTKLSYNTCSIDGNYLGVTDGQAQLYLGKQGVLVIGISKTGIVAGTDGDGKLATLTLYTLTNQIDTLIEFNSTNSILKSPTGNISGTNFVGGKLNYQ